VRELAAEDGATGIGVGVEVDEAEQAVAARAGAYVGLGDAVVATEDDRDRTGVEHLAHRPLDRCVAGNRVGGNDRGVAVVDDPQRGERVDPGLEVRTGRAAGGADRARAEAGPGPVGDEVVRRRADDRDVDPGELAGVLRVGGAAEARQAGEVGLLAVLAPTLQRIDHRKSVFHLSSGTR
jgi:hypothetical protein